MLNDGKTEARKEAEADVRKLFHCYHTVFGREGMRTEAQKIVWEDMKARGRLESAIFIADGAGVIDPLRAALTEGGRLYVLQIQAILKKDPDEPRALPTVKI